MNLNECRVGRRVVPTEGPWAGQEAEVVRIEERAAEDGSGPPLVVRVKFVADSKTGVYDARWLRPVQ